MTVQVKKEPPTGTSADLRQAPESAEKLSPAAGNSPGFRKFWMARPRSGKITTGYPEDPEVALNRSEKFIVVMLLKNIVFVKLEQRGPNITLSKLVLRILEHQEGILRNRTRKITVN